MQKTIFIIVIALIISCGIASATLYDLNIAFSPSHLLFAPEILSMDVLLILFSYHLRILALSLETSWDAVCRIPLSGNILTHTLSIQARSI